ncbi:hypothetical protein COV20_05980 [Candidatus Woesearchaeota archaeon CG10_big_fil_rev_8_21_14_0_10_45_16]|nr:MAG: hypothetical protein COV20_05980 [Candidatus Woesearchaeota archaeon CG10_big_fil_rev_8_21_14_0_10_45_16]
MFKWYGFLGILTVIFIEANFFLKIQPFADWYFPIVWFGYILTIDAIVHKLRGKSLISDRFWQFLGMIIISALLWWIFEFLNLPLQNWSYQGLEGLKSNSIVTLFGLLSFATVLPALFETVELIRSIHLFESKRLKRSHKITKRFLYTMISLGVICFLTPLILPAFTFPLVWLSFFFIIDPINYLHKQPSIIGHLKDKRLAIPLSLLLAGIILGFLWEFWNYWAIPKWTYNIPFVGFFKIFEMPILGYLGYFPFSFELYAMYWFVRSLFLKKEKLLIR